MIIATKDDKRELFEKVPHDSMPASEQGETVIVFAELMQELFRMVRAADPELLEYYYGVRSDDITRETQAGTVLAKHPEGYLLHIPSVEKLWLPAAEGGLYHIPASSEEKGLRVIPLGMSVDHLDDINEALKFDPNGNGVAALVTKDRQIEQRVIKAVTHAVRCQWDLPGTIQMLWVGREERCQYEGINLEYCQYYRDEEGLDTPLAEVLLHLEASLMQNLGGLQKSQIVVVEQVGEMEVGIRDELAVLGQKPGVNVIVTMTPEDAVAMCAREELMAKQMTPIVGQISAKHVRGYLAKEFGALEGEFLVEMEKMTRQQLLVLLPGQEETGFRFERYWALN